MATRIDFEVYGLTELQQRFNQASDTVLRVSLNEGLRKLGRLIVPSKGTGPLANETPKRTGKGARSTFFRLTGDPKNQRLEVLQPAQNAEGEFYLEYVRDGTKPHVIRPKRVSVLRFVIDGKVVFSKLVHHPGTLANQYHIRTLSRLQGNIQQIVNEIGNKVTAYLAGR